MHRIWFTADLHLEHPAIIKHCNRPISADKQNDWLINRINERVSKNDTLYILGDVSMTNKKNTEKLVNKINGHKHLILGNHDKNLKNSKIFESVSLIKNVRIKQKNNTYNIVLCHYPIASWEGKVKGSYHFYGHTHSRFKNNGKSYDVGVDNNNYYPIELQNIITIIDNTQNERNV